MTKDEGLMAWKRLERKEEERGEVEMIGHEASIK
jgi:hypothetical protein